MKTDKLKQLQAEKQKLEDRLSAPVPAKHAESPESFRAFLRNELRLVNLKIEKAKGI